MLALPVFHIISLNIKTKGNKINTVSPTSGFLWFVTAAFIIIFSCVYLNSTCGFTRARRYLIEMIICSIFLEHS